MQVNALSVQELNEYVRKLLAGDPMLRGIAVRGEVSNFKQHVSGHWYFSLKDDQSRIACVMFRQHNQLLRFVPRDGMRLVLMGSAGLYTASGSYQFYAEGAMQEGVGDLYQRFLALKDLLSREGLFDAARKRPLPLLPRAVGIVTSSTGAVLHDIRTVAARRFPGVRLVLRPAKVQGEGAASDIAAGIAEVAAIPDLDVLIVGRGGGSIEDLWAFNEEIVVRAIVNSPKPVISAVGHETDVTLADFAADMRAPTPSAAAELAVPDRLELLRQMGNMRSALYVAAERMLSGMSMRLSEADKRLQARKPEAALALLQSRVRLSQQAITSRMDRALEQGQAALAQLSGRLQAVGPMSTLRRGYAIVLDGDTPVTSVEQAAPAMTVMLQDGKIDVTTMHTRKEHPFDTAT